MTIAVEGIHVNRQSQAERELRAYLKSLPWPWSIEPGAKHSQVVIGGKPVGVICHQRGKKKDAKQIIGAVKRRVRELETNGV